jgi:hypothetical protein
MTPGAKVANLHGRVDPRRDDERARIWHAHELTLEQKRAYVADCVEALEADRDPKIRYLPSAEEFAAFSRAVSEELRLTPGLRGSAVHALKAWGVVFGEAA